MLQELFHRLKSWSALRDVTDARLLEQFFNQQDEAAFAQLVQRHGPMVLGVCRRLLARPQDVEDAFQATFLVLVRKGRSLRAGTVLGAWLHGVAWRTAKKAQAMNATTWRRTELLITEPLSSDDSPVEQRDLRQVLDEEVDRLPVHLKAVVVAAWLEGRSKSETAQLLGWPEGTVATRLAAARQRLVKQLQRRGVSLGTGLAAADLGLTSLAEAPPAALSHAATAAAVQALKGPWIGTAAISVTAYQLAEGVLGTMNAISAKKAIIVLVTVLALSAGAGVAGWGVGWGNEPTRTNQANPTASAPVAASLEERLRGNWTITGIDYRKDATETWQPVQGGGGFLRFFANGEFSGGTVGSIPGRIGMTLFNPTSQRFKATEKQEAFTLEILRTQDGTPRIISVFTGQWDQGNLLLTYSWHDQREVRLTARRATEEENLNGGWTNTTYNEVTRDVIYERVLVFRAGKYVAQWRAVAGKSIESSPAAFKLDQQKDHKFIVFEGKGAALALEGPVVEEAHQRIYASYSLENDSLVVAAFTSAAKQAAGEAPWPLPKTEDEARQQGAVLVKFHRGYVPNRTRVGLERPAANPATEKNEAPDLRQTPSVRAITEKMRGEAEAIFASHEDRLSRWRTDSKFTDPQWQELFTWSRRWCDAELGLAQDAAQRQKAIEAHMKRLQKVENAAANLPHPTRLFFEHHARYHRLEAERWLEEERLKQKP